MSVLTRFFNTYGSKIKNADRLTVVQRCALIAAAAGTVAAAVSYSLDPVKIFRTVIVLSCIAGVLSIALLVRKSSGIMVYMLIFLLLSSYALYRYTPGIFPYGERLHLVVRVLSYPVFRRNTLNFDARVVGTDRFARIKHRSSTAAPGEEGFTENIHHGTWTGSGGPGVFEIARRRSVPMVGSRVRVRTGPGLRIDRGDTLALEGVFFTVPDDGFGSYGRYLRSSGVGALFEGHTAKASITKRPAVFTPILIARRLRAYILYVNKRTLPYPHNEFASALLTGDRSHLPGYMTDAFRKSGTMHILAVSGLHIGYLVIFVFFILRLFRLNRVVIYALLGAFVLFFMIFVGERPSVQRAATMTLCGIFCYLFDRDKQYMNILALAFFLLWLLNPLSIENPGFLLSFCAVFGILFLTGPLFSVLRKYMPGFLAGSLAASVSVQVFIFPVMTVFFQEFPYINIVANISIVPLAGLSLALEAGTLILYPIILPAGLLLAEVNTAVIAAMFHLARLFARVPPVSVPSLPAFFIPVYLLVAGILLLPIAWKKREDEVVPQNALT
jgi:ComEC/Rec2-related protein